MKLKQRKVRIFSVVLFIIILVIIISIIGDRSDKGFLFRKGTPWLYDDLYADRDFAILKTDDEIIAEKDSIIKSVYPVFVVDTNGTFDFINYLIKALDAQIRENMMARSLSNSEEKHLNEINSFVALKNSFDSLLRSSYYVQGVIDPLANFNGEIVNKINIFNGSYYALANYCDFITAQKLKDKILSITSLKKLDSYFNKSFSKLISRTQFMTTLHYNDSLTNAIIENKINSISPSYGLVKKGELIIKKGTIIGDREYRILNTLKKEKSENFIANRKYFAIIGALLLFFILFGVLFYYGFYFQSKKLSKIRDVLYVNSLLLITVLSVYFIFKYTDFNINVFPFALLPLLIISFYSFHVALFYYLFTLLISSFFAYNGFEFIFTQLLAGIVAMYSLKIRNRRSQILKTVILVFSTYIIIDIGFKLLGLQSIGISDLKTFIPFLISSFLLLLYFPLLFIVEKLFGFVSDYTLLELSDMNNPLLRLLSQKAPGTFQHSVQLANIVENVVRELKGNSLLARTGALYHDVGKTNHPEYYIENQSGFNVHDSLDYEDSAQKIISHVEEGVKLARKFKLPEQIIDFITMHHGTSMTKYFYNMWVNANPGIAPIESNFRYPGPKPNSLETAVLMMADGIEAASRTLKDFSQQSIEKMVSNIIDSQIQSGQFDNVDLTFKEISRIKQIFVENVKSIYHSRIVYPEINNKY